MRKYCNPFEQVSIEVLKLFRFLPFYGGMALMIGIGIANFWNFDVQVEEAYRRALGFDPSLNFEYFYLSQMGQKIHFLAYFATLILVLIGMEVEQRAKFFTFRLPVLPINPHHYLFAKYLIISLFVMLFLIVLHGTVVCFVENRFPQGVPYLKNVPFVDILQVHFWQMLVVLTACIFAMLAFLLYFRLNWIVVLLILGFCYGLGMFLPAFYPFSTFVRLNLYESKPIFTPDLIGACLAGALAYFLCYQKIRKT